MWDTAFDFAVSNRLKSSRFTASNAIPALA